MSTDNWLKTRITLYIRPDHLNLLLNRSVAIMKLLDYAYSKRRNDHSVGQWHTILFWRLDTLTLAQFGRQIMLNRRINIADGRRHDVTKTGGGVNDVTADDIVGDVICERRRANTWWKPSGGRACCHQWRHRAVCFNTPRVHSNKTSLDRWSRSLENVLWELLETYNV